MARFRSFIVSAAGLALLAPAASAQTPQTTHQELEVARNLAEAAPDALSRRTLGQVALPTYETAKFRKVRGYYIHQELVNDQVIFCGELIAVVPKTKRRSGWTKFVYIPGDPTTLMTDTDGIGTPEIGPDVRRRLCDEAKPDWFAEDFTAYFQRLPASLAEARSAD